MKRAAFSHARFALCEGNEDAALVRKLIDTAARGIKAFDVSPINDLSDAKGSGGFGESIIGSEPMTNFGAVSEVVIIADNDDDPDGNFEMVRGQLQKAKENGDLQRDWGVPDQPYVREAGDPSVTIWMWPGPGKHGCLETVLWDIVLKKYKAEANCVETALACTGADQWATSKRDKARIRCFMSLYYKKNPALALSLAWRDAPQMFPPQSAEFTPIARFLASL